METEVQNPVLAITEHPSSTNLSDAVRQALQNYLQTLEGAPPINLYDIVLETVEEPLLRVVMQYTRNNQVKAAKALGIARGTLRALLKQYGMIS